MTSKPPRDTYKAALIVIGNEILSGRTHDTNTPWIAEKLVGMGIVLTEVRVVQDVEADIISAVHALKNSVDYLFTTGGIGPTHDDITADAVAKAFDVSIDVDPRAVAMMLERFPQSDLTPARLRMARIPDGADLIANDISKAPGFFIGNVIVMAGVPKIMEAMLRAVTPRLRTGARLLSLTIDAQTREGNIAPVLAAAQVAFPDVQMGSYPYDEKGRYGALLVLRSTEAERLDAAAQGLRAALDEAGLPWADAATPDMR